MAYLIVFLGAGIGGVLRHLANAATLRLGHPAYAGTLVINVTGSFVIGLLAGCLALAGGLPHRLQLFLTTGIVGGYTTFSAFSLEAVLLLERGAYATALGYVAASVTLSLGATFAGLVLVRVLAQGAGS